MKKLIFIFSIILITSFSSCSDYLEENNIANVTAGSYYVDNTGIEDAVRAAYGIMKEYYGPEIGWTMSSFGTDIYQEGADGSHKYVNRYDAGHNSAARYFRDTWRIFYEQINQTNAVLGRIDDAEGMDSGVKTTRTAEVRFLRALAYFNLTRHYGDIHLTLEETSGAEITANKTASSEIYSQAIIPDLEFAIANLPDKPSDYGRASKPAAQFLMAKVKLTRSYTSFAGGSDATDAESLMTSVINNSQFSLVKPFGDLWKLENEANSEFIWTIQNSKSQVDEKLDGYGHRAHLYFLMEYDKKPGMQRDTENGRPWKRFRPTDYLLTLWDRTMDRRYDETYKHVWYCNKAPDPKLPGVAIGDTAILIPGPGIDKNGVDKEGYWTAAKKESVRYTVYTASDYSARTFPSMNKWIDNTRPNRQHTQGQRDYVLMRLADAILIRAEARLKQGNTAGAADDINIIRERAAWTGKEADMRITASDVTIDMLLEERARELVGEGHRWFDLVRTGKLVELVKKHNVTAQNIKAHHIVRPIPQDQIDRTEGGYTQNPGYAQ